MGVKHVRFAGEEKASWLAAIINLRKTDLLRLPNLGLQVGAMGLDILCTQVGVSEN